MAQGDIYSIDIGLYNSSQSVRIENDSIVISAIVLFWTINRENKRQIGGIGLHGRSNFRFFRKSTTNTLEKGLAEEIPVMKKLKLNAGEYLDFEALSDGSRDSAFLNAKITLMEV